MLLARYQRLLLLAFAAIILFASAVPAVSAAPAKGSATSPDTELRPVQVFDVAAGRVVSTLPNDKKFQKMALSWTESVTRLAPQMTAGQSCSYVYRVPLAKPATVQSGDVKISTSDLFLFYCKGEEPMLLVFDERRKPYLFLFKADIEPFIKKVGIPSL
ncbi:hypothetical protein D3P09_20825 [Paenibacillus pinisoli]|uniref:Uncharacterized protein n=1 Tax=Paenibacillus pinisoli TaxID=1276110 RepID=A0A3A6PPJ8_9BACL|nr:hypothetical protein [Paenibacillus pinisoli]RJX38491.1 hypothetical protein D3P09_20825 [Paenibacillus pinisoli]